MKYFAYVISMTMYDTESKLGKLNNKLAKTLD